MENHLLTEFGDSSARIERALLDLKNGKGILLVDDEDRENEGDIIFPAATITNSQMAMLIKECSGIVCLCLTDEKIQQLQLPQMVKNNTSKYETAFTVSIEASVGITTGVSAQDRVTTIKTAVNPNCKPEDLNRPGHIFPLRARTGGVLSRRGHTEGSVDLVEMAGFMPAAVLCELTNEDGSMAKLPTIINFAVKNDMVVLTIDDIVNYRISVLDHTLSSQ